MMLLTERAKSKLFGANIDNEKGCFLVKLYKSSGKKFVVTVDERIPCTADGHPLFAHSSDSLWVSLVHKAIAKACGSYANTSKL
jgi:hypothetical protein